MTFTAQDETPAFATAAEAYGRLWVDEGLKIVEAMEPQSGSKAD